jgi:formylglycine-generating enzyme required for sulfatase activity
VTQSGAFDSNQNYLSDVGAFSNSASRYGTFDQSGNVWEWNDLDGLGAGQRGVRGGYWNAGQSFLVSTYGITMVPSYEGDDLGFRLASPVAVPEPSTCVMALAGLAYGGYLVRRRRKHTS